MCVCPLTHGYRAEGGRVCTMAPVRRLLSPPVAQDKHVRLTDLWKIFVLVDVNLCFAVAVDTVSHSRVYLLR